MPLPQNVVERLSRESPRTPGWSRQLLMFSSTALFISIFVYLGIIFGYLPYLNSQVKQLDGQIQAFSQKIPADQQVQIANFYSQLANLQYLLKNHVSATPLMSWLEKNTEANVYFTKFSLNTANRQLILSGIAKSVNDFASQLQIFRQDSGIDRVSFSDISASGNGLWQFDVTLFFKTGFFSVQNSLTQ